MPMPTLLTISPNHQPARMRANRLDYDVLTWAVIPRRDPNDPAALLHLSAAGPHATLKALWASVVTLPAHILRLPTNANARNRTELRASRLGHLHGHYRTHWNNAPLPVSGHSHVSITADVALDAARSRSVIVLQPATGPIDVALVAAILNRRLALPLPPHWQEVATAQRLWDDACTLGAATPLPAFGCRAYWLALDHPGWGRSIVAALRDVPLRDVGDMAPITVGAAVTRAADLTASETAEEEEEQPHPETQEEPAP